MDALGEDLSRYASIDVPVLLLVGAASPARQQRNCEDLAAVLPHVRVERMHALGHVAHAVEPRLVAGRIESFSD